MPKRAKRLKVDKVKNKKRENRNNLFSTLINLGEDIIHTVCTNIVKYLSLEDILEFKKCSWDCLKIGNEMLANLRAIELDGNTNYGLLSPIARFDIFAQPAQHCRSLRRLVLKNLVFRKNKTISALIRNNPHLKNIKMHSCQVIDCKNKPLHTIAVTCKELTKLSLKGMLCNEIFLDYLAKHNTNLVKLEIRCNNRVILQECLKHFFSKQPKLKWINLEGLLLNDNKPISPVLAVIAEVCRNLKYLNILNCHGVGGIYNKSLA